MKLIFKLCMLFTLLSGFCLADICTSPAFDGAGVLGSNIPQVEKAAIDLASHGAEAHLITVNLDGYPTLDKLVAQAVEQCPTWQSPNGGVKSTLLVIAVAPKEHKMGIFSGESFGPAFAGGRMLRYRTDFMAPHFKAGEWSEGLITTANQMAGRLAEFTSEANQPVTNNTVNQASDYSGLLTVMKYLMFFGFTGLIIWLAVGASRKRKQLQQAGKRAQQVAISAKNRAAGLVSALTKQLAYQTATDTGKPGFVAANDLVDQASADFSSLANSLSTDPSDEHLPASSYQAIGDLYDGVCQKLERAMSFLRNPDNIQSQVSDVFRSEPKSQPFTPQTSTTPIPQNPQTQTQPEAPTHTTTIIHDDNSFTNGLVLGEVLADRREERYREPERREPERREPEPERETKHDEDRFSDESGSSGFGSDTSSSSTSSDSGSSDFGSSSDSSSFSSDSGSSDF